MTENSPQSPNAASTSRAEKLSLLRSLLGHETVARLNAEHERAAPDGGSEQPLAPDRAAWHRNKLLERLRERAPKQGAQPEAPLAAPHMGAPTTLSRAKAAVSTNVDVRLAAAREFRSIVVRTPSGDRTSSWGHGPGGPRRRIEEFARAYRTFGSAANAIEFRFFGC